MKANESLLYWNNGDILVFQSLVQIFVYMTKKLNTTETNISGLCNLYQWCVLEFMRGKMKPIYYLVQDDLNHDFDTMLKSFVFGDNWSELDDFIRKSFGDPMSLYWWGKGAKLCRLDFMDNLFKKLFGYTNR